ncbi:MAG: thioredoxin domain-containing protein [Candidatus Solibacter usitatus]|nr:thioredoxin domain-containing protein [Candidatus Solibacter usitatus]
MHTNRLAQEKSPYLLQHAHNPVDWYPWGEAAFEKARKEEKPIFLSIGYSTCHWCHVMERESFENEQIAAVMNQHFVSIKVDREERPDVDRIYMTYVQATTGGGGWPMSVWLTPDLKPFVGGTYFPPDNRYGKPGFPAVLERIAQAWREDRERILASSANVLEELRRQTEGGARPGAPIRGKDALDTCFFILRRTFDTKLGGFGGAPKFPRPVTHNFLLRYHARTGNREALDMVLLTLREMAKGGMNDQLGGGFHRYSVDERWFVPHFEKMLYDQAQLAVSYLEAFQLTHDREYANVARQIFDYVLRDMTDPDGGFYSAEDADSVIDPAHPQEKGEGAFYIWKQPEIEKILGQPAAKYFGYRYGVEADGNVQNDPHHEFTGKNILYQARSLAQTAEHFEEPPEEIAASIAASRARLVAERSRRVRPHLDDKILTAWNGLMISALAKGGAVLNEPRYVDAADRAAHFILGRLYNPETGVLLRRFRQRDAAIPGFLDDYAFFTQGLLDLYEAAFNLRYLRSAIKLTEKQMALFEDREHGAFFSSAAGDSSLVLRMKEDYDGAEPSGNSIAALNLLRLAQITDRKEFREPAERLFRALASTIMASPVSVPQLLAAFEFSLSKPKQIILAGDRSPELLAELHARFVPNRIVLLVSSDEERRFLAGFLPVVETMTASGGKPTAYVCQDYTCKLPTTDPKKFAELLQ